MFAHRSAERREGVLTLRQSTRTVAALTTLNRRSFVRRTAAAVVGAACAPAWVGAQPRRIVVIGAGMAGLSTAFELTALGHDVTVLEARTRPGGRVFTLRESFADGLYADAGAMQVYDSHTRAQKYIKQFELELDPIRATAPGSLMHLGTADRSRPAIRRSSRFRSTPMRKR